MSEQGAQPSRLGGYELLDRLGKGGMGTVLKARQVSLDRLVALKILPQKLAQDERYVQRFLREARSAARLRHPNIVQAIDVGQVEGHYVFAMEFVDGETLSAILARDGPLKPERALRYLKQTASALAAAHDAGIVHRDIKPSNLMIDRQDEVRVTDFGLAKRTEGDIAVTADGQTLGTPAYVAPEMAKGGEADARSDLYSLGATFFHLLAGRPPFVGRNVSEVLIMQATEPPPLLGSLAPRCDPRLCRVIDRLLRKNPAERFPSADALLKELEGLGTLKTPAEMARAEGRAMLAEAPTLPLSAGRRLEREAAAKAHRRQARGRRTALVAGAIILVLLAVIVGIVVATRPGSTRPQTKATPPATSTPTVAPPVVPPKPTTEASPAIPKPTTSEVPSVKPPGPKPGEWVDLFDGKSLDGWQILEGESFKDHGKVHVADGVLRMDLGPGPRPITGIVYKGTVPTDNYEVEFEAMRTGGNLDFANLTFPIGDSICSLVVGGAVQGNLIGLQKVDGKEPWQDAGHKWRPFERNTWYRVRLRVAPDALAAWVDDEKQFTMPRAGHRFDSFWVLAEAKPFGVVTYITGGAIRSLRLRRLDAAAPPEAVPGERAKWDAIKADARKLIDAGKLDEAAKLLDGAKALPLDGIADLVAEQLESIESIKSTRLKAALAAYAKQSDLVWDLFKKRDYAEADKLLASLAASLPKVPHLREGIAQHLKADQEAARRLKEFWAVVEKGLAAKTGQFLSFKGAAGGTLVAVRDGTATIKPPKGEPESRRVQDLVAKQAVAHADLEGDAHSSLLKGVFLLAEGEDLDKAEKSFEHTGDEGHVARYKERLAPLLAAKVAAPVGPMPEVQPAAGPKWQVYTKWPSDAAEAKRRQKATADAVRVKVEQEVEIAKGVKMAFVLIPAGEFLMGSSPTTTAEQRAAAYGSNPGDYEREFPQRRVKISQPFWMAKTEVTQEQWTAVFPVDPSFYNGRPKNPVETVSWEDVSGYAKVVSEKLKKTFRLPTEAEWEYACRAGTATEFYWGDDAAKIHNYAWVGSSTAPVGTKEPNAWGLCDMAGNVWDMCEDWFGKYPDDSETDPKGPPAGPHRVVRGGSWGNRHSFTRSALRGFFGRAPCVGFRLLQVLPASGRQETPKVERATEPTPERRPPVAGKWEVYKDWPFDATEAVRRQKATAKALGVKVEQEVEIARGVNMAFVLIPAGEFLMGSPPTTSAEMLGNLFGRQPWIDYQNEFPQHRVKITRPFWLGKYEVTQEQWQGVMGWNPSRFGSLPKNPAEQMNWEQCKEFCTKLSLKLNKSFRLPTEAEWEYACRAGAPTEFYFGDTAQALGEYGWFSGNSSGSTHQVGSRKPNALGLFDMAGNVWEWCEDWFGAYDKADQEDPNGHPWGGVRVLRGGSWSHPTACCRSAFRMRNDPHYCNFSSGFRVVLAPGPR